MNTACIAVKEISDDPRIEDKSLDPGVDMKRGKARTAASATGECAITVWSHCGVLGGKQVSTLINPTSAANAPEKKQKRLLYLSASDSK